MISPSASLAATSRRTVLGLVAMAITGTTPATAQADPAFDEYVNVEYPPVATTDGLCPEGYALDFIRGDRCVSMRGLCDEQLWTCEGKPARHDHPQFACLPDFKRAQRCARAYQPREEGVTPMETHGKHPGRCCWRYKPKRYRITGEQG